MKLTIESVGNILCTYCKPDSANLFERVGNVDSGGIDPLYGNTASNMDFKTFTMTVTYHV